MNRRDQGASIGHEDVHVWLTWLDQPAWRVQQLARTLSPIESERAGRFHFPTDRQRFAVGRGVLRSILGRYLDLAPAQVPFSYNAHGKPHLSEESDRAAIRFNVAHSHRLAIYAFARGREVGIDLEFVRPIPRLSRLAAISFSAREQATLFNLPPARQLDAFYLCWTRKEAYLKAIGVGLAHPLDRFDVSLAPGEPARLLRVEGHPEEVDRWSLWSWTPAPGYVASLAVEGHGCHPTFWETGQDLAP